jgi:hypothetical protein
MNGAEYNMHGPSGVGLCGRCMLDSSFVVSFCFFWTSKRRKELTNEKIS